MIFRKACISLAFVAISLVLSCSRPSFESATENPEDVEYMRLMDSVESVLDRSCYYDFSDSLLKPALAYYEQNDGPHDLWMQARCHYLAGCLIFDKNRRSEEATTHFIEALQLLDAHFDASQAPVGQLYSKICHNVSRLAHNFADEPCCQRFARLGLDYATAVHDTTWMLRSYANLALLYERFGKPGEGDTAYFYGNEGLRMADASRFPYETALLLNALANCDRHSGEYDSAFLRFEKSESLIDSTFPLYHRNHTEKAFVYYCLQDYVSAVANLEIAYQSSDVELKTQAACGLADCYERLGDTLKAMPYYALVKAHKEKETVQNSYNAETLSMLNNYLKDRKKDENSLLWIVILLVVMALLALAVYHRGYRKKLVRQHEEIKRDLQEAHGALKVKEREALQTKAKAIYDDHRDNTLGRLLDLFNATYPDALPRLKATYPDLNETELKVFVLSCLGLRLKETADILDLRENTVAKYRTSLKRKVSAEAMETLLSGQNAES